MKISHVIFNSKKILVTTLPMLHGLPIRLHTTWYDLTLGLVPTWNALFSIPKFANIPFSPYGSEIGRSIYTNYLLLIPHGFVVENPPKKKKKTTLATPYFSTTTQNPKTPSTPKRRSCRTGLRSNRPVDSTGGSGRLFHLDEFEHDSEIHQGEIRNTTIIFLL